ncbi:MAG: protein kinase [Kofleriaceae bacterium]
MLEPPAPAPRLSEGPLPRRWRGYDLLEFLGERRRGETFLARYAEIRAHAGLGLTRGLLWLERGIVQLDDFERLRVDESRLVMRYHHPGLCEVVELEVVDGAPLFVREYAPGISLLELRRRLARRGTPCVPWPAAASVALQLCDLLGYVHQAHGWGLVVSRNSALRDSKLLVDGTGHVRLTQLESHVSAPRDKPTGCDLRSLRMCIAPEAARGRPLDSRADLFCLGWLLWELLTGQRLFHGETDFDTLKLIAAARVEPPSRYAPALPAKLDEVVLSALQLAPEDRPTSAQLAGRLGELGAPEDARAQLATLVREASAAATSPE